MAPGLSYIEVHPSSQLIDSNDTNTNTTSHIPHYIMHMTAPATSTTSPTASATNLLVASSTYPTLQQQHANLSSLNFQQPQIYAAPPQPPHAYMYQEQLIYSNPSGAIYATPSTLVQQQQTPPQQYQQYQQVQPDTRYIFNK